MKSDLKKSQICPIWDQSEQIWAKSDSRVNQALGKSDWTKGSTDEEIIHLGHGPHRLKKML